MILAVSLAVKALKAAAHNAIDNEQFTEANDIMYLLKPVVSFRQRQEQANAALLDEALRKTADVMDSWRTNMATAPGTSGGHPYVRPGFTATDEEALKTGGRIGAIRSMRTRGVPFQQAKEAVDSWIKTFGWVPSTVETSSGLTQNEIKILKARGIIPAIREYCDRTGEGLKESKDAVENYVKSSGLRRIDDSGTSNRYAHWPLQRSSPVHPGEPGNGE